MTTRVARWTTGFGTESIDEVRASFTEDETDYVVVPCGRGTYDVQQPYTVLKVGDNCELGWYNGDDVCWDSDNVEELVPDEAGCPT